MLSSGVTLSINTLLTVSSLGEVVGGASEEEGSLGVTAARLFFSRLLICASRNFRIIRVDCKHQQKHGSVLHTVVPLCIQPAETCLACCKALASLRLGPAIPVYEEQHQHHNNNKHRPLTFFSKSAESLASMEAASIHFSSLRALSSCDLVSVRGGEEGEGERRRGTSEPAPTQRADHDDCCGGVFAD